MLNCILKSLKIFPLILLLAVTNTNAQNNDKFGNIFGGKWITYSSGFSKGENCILDLSSVKTGEVFPIKLSQCSGELAAVTSWTINKGQLALVNKKQKLIATLGGNQFRLSGKTQGAKIPVIIEKLPRAKVIYQARKSIRCVYIGYGQECAKPQQFAPPVVIAGRTSPVKILVSLNARIEPRPTARVLGILKPNSCIGVKACTVASDGLWCEAEFSGKSGWFKKQAVRQKQWPVLTFLSGC